jgi:hypothetical protein
MPEAIKRAVSGARSRDARRSGPIRGTLPVRTSTRARAN